MAARSAAIEISAGDKNGYSPNSSAACTARFLRCRTELAGLRTGRASTSLLEPIHVDAYGSSMPLNQVASVSVPEPRMLSVQVWDKALVSAVDRAIREANLGLNPIMDGRCCAFRSRR